MTTATTPTGPVTLDDVRAALADTDPTATNASALRAALGGRGSYATIQRHLDSIRAERLAAAAPVATTDTPAMPPELASLWGAAYAHAVVTVRTRLDQVVQERDALAAQVQTARRDLDAAATELEGLSSRVAERDQQLAIAVQERAAAAEELATAKAATEAAEARLSHELAEARQGAVVEGLKAQAGLQALQSQIDRQVNMLAELKSALHAPVTPDVGGIGAKP